MKASSAWARQGYPVHEEQDAGDHTGFEEPLDERGGGARLARPGRHLDQQAAPAEGNLGAQSVNALDLVVSVHDAPVGFDRGQVAANLPCSDAAFQVVLGIEPCDLPSVGVGLPVKEPDLLAVRQEDERNFELLGVVASLVLCGDWVDAGVLSLQCRHRASGSVAEHIV